VSRDEGGVPSIYADNEREITGSFRVSPAGDNNIWRTISFILGLIISGGVVFSILGKAFYVTRTEYTDKVLSDSIERTDVKKTLEAMNKLLGSVEVSLKNLSDTVSDLKTGGERAGDTRVTRSKRVP
jgi:hypothetical protein